MSEKKVCVSEQFIKQLQERNVSLEQQLKAAKAQGIRLAAENCMAFKAFDDHRFFIDRQDLYEFAYKVELEYANSLEGK